MGRSEEQTVAGYLDSLSAEGKSALSAVRKVIKKNLPRGVEEGMLWGMIAYSIPLSKYPNTYNGQPLCVAGLAAQKNHNAVYLMNVYGNSALAKWFNAEYVKSGKKLDMGKSCVRFKTLDDLPLELVGQAIAKTSVDEMIALAEAAHPPKKKAPAKKKAATKKKAAAKKKAPARKRARS